MFSTTIKRSVATLGVVAGLLAAAVPASAWSGPAGVPGNYANDAVKAGASEVLYETVTVKAPKPSDADRTLITNGSADDNMYHLPDVNDEVLAVKAPASAQGGPQDPAFRFEMAGLPVKAPTNAGTQVGSEALALDDYGPHVLTLDGASSDVFELNTFGGDDTLKVETEVTDYRADAGTGHDKLLIGKDSTHFHDGSSNTVMFAETGRSDAKTPSLIAKGTQVGSEGVKDEVPLETVSFTFKGEVIGLEPNALGTQVGSEGVKAPTRADDQMYNPKEIGID